MASESSRLRMWEALLSLVAGGAWLTRPERLGLVGNKAVQYLRATQAGLAVPPTLMSNDPDAVRANIPDRPVMKYGGDSAILWAAGGEGYAATTVEASIDRVDDASIIAAPAIYQARLDSATEVRAVVIRAVGATNVFAAAASKPAGLIDIRLAPDAMVSYARVELPADITAGLVRLMEECDVGFCSADLIMTPAGEYVFLDLNATGAWWWIDDLYDGAITDALAGGLVAIAERTVKR